MSSLREAWGPTLKEAAYFEDYNAGKRAVGLDVERARLAVVQAGVAFRDLADLVQRLGGKSEGKLRAASNEMFQMGTTINRAKAHVR